MLWGLRWCWDRDRRQPSGTSEATVGRGWRHWGESADPGILCACDSRILGAEAWGWGSSPAGKRCLSIDRGLARGGGGVAPVCPRVRGLEAEGVVDIGGSWNGEPRRLITAAAGAGLQPLATLSFLPQPFPNICSVPTGQPSCCPQGAFSPTG